MAGQTGGVLAFRRTTQDRPGDNWPWSLLKKATQYFSVSQLNSVVLLSNIDLKWNQDDFCHQFYNFYYADTEKKSSSYKTDDKQLNT